MKEYENKIKLTGSLEDYLEAAYMFEKKNGFSRIKELSDFLNVKLPSVNKAIKQLERRKLLTHKRYGYIKLTKGGKRLADNLLSTHDMLFNFFKSLGFDKKKSLKYGCYLEHIIDENDKPKIKALIKFLKEKNYGDKPFKSD